MTDGALDKKTREYVALAIAITQRCEPCVTLHIEALIKVFNAEFATAAGKKPINEEWPVKVEFPPAAHPDLKYLAETAIVAQNADTIYRYMNFDRIEEYAENV